MALDIPAKASMAWRALKKMRRKPEQFFDVTIQPLLFTAMFGYLFGGAVSGSVQRYLPLLIPGIVAQSVRMATGVQLRSSHWCLDPGERPFRHRHSSGWFRSMWIGRQPVAADYAGELEVGLVGPVPDGSVPKE